MFTNLFSFLGKRDPRRRATPQETPAPLTASQVASQNMACWQNNCALVENALFGDQRNNKLSTTKCLAIRLEGKNATPQPDGNRAKELLMEDPRKLQLTGYVYDEATGWIFAAPYHFQNAPYAIVNNVMNEFKNAKFEEVRLINWKA